MNQLDKLRLLDLATTARKVSTQCLVVALHSMGGVANIGMDGARVYVYVGGPLEEGLASGDRTIPPNSTGYKERLN